MAIEGKVRTLYTDKTQQEAIFPTTKVSAVTDDEGNGLNTLLEHIAYVDPMDMESATVLANADTLGGYPASDYAFVEDLKNLKPEDIGAAPGGYGLGEITSGLPDSEDLNNIKHNGWYAWSADINKKPANAPIGPGTDHLDVMRVSGSGEACIQEVFDVSDSYNCGLKMQRTIYGSDSRYVSEWEWVNPPMTIGVEYRTTERYEGKHVYVKLVDFGNLPSNTYKDVNFSSVVVSAVRMEGVLKYPNEETYLNLSGTAGVASVQSMLNKIRITTNTTSLVNWTAKVMVYYTKD